MCFLCEKIQVSHINHKYNKIQILLNNLFVLVFRAVNEARTRDPQLGKLVLYQLSYYRKRADTGTRTRDLFITNELLYQLSHIGIPF